METRKVTYQYFMLGDCVPVRVAFNDKGLRIGAEVPDRDKGELVQDATYLSRLAVSFEVGSIAEQEFHGASELILIGHPYAERLTYFRYAIFDEKWAIRIGVDDNIKLGAEIFNSDTREFMPKDHLLKINDDTRIKYVSILELYKFIRHT